MTTYVCIPYIDNLALLRICVYVFDAYINVIYLNLLLVIYKCTIVSAYIHLDIKTR